MKNKKYTIDGRDPNAKGYVKEERMATHEEDEACRKALMCFRVGDAWSKDIDFFLYGRLDDVYGWYVFGVKGGDKPQFLILGDCLDPLEAPYNKVLGLNEVIQFARNEGSGNNIGTAYEAMQDWGVFHSLSDGFCAFLDEEDVCVENERAYWDAKRNEWKLSYDVMFYTDRGGNECVTITIPAQSGDSDEADREFYSEWTGKCAAYNAEERYEDFLIDDKEVSVKDAKDWAESKERAMVEIRRAISNYLDEVITPDEDDALAESRERVKGEQGYVWVLTIMKEGQNFPEVHKTFEGAVESAICDIQEHMDEDEVDDYDYVSIRKALTEQRFYEEEHTDASYDICSCPVVR